VNAAHPILLVVPVLAGSAAVVCTIFIHALPLSATIAFVRREKRLGHLGINFWKDIWLVTRTIFYAFMAHLVEIALWAAFFLLPDPLETADGMLLFGVSTAMIFAVIQRMVESRYADSHG